MPCERLRRADGAYTSESESALFSKQLCVFTVILSPDSTEQPRDGGGGMGQSILRSSGNTSPSPEWS